jgi:hypothetical protein
MRGAYRLLRLYIFGQSSVDERLDLLEPRNVVLSIVSGLNVQSGNFTHFLLLVLAVLENEVG